MPPSDVPERTCPRCGGTGSVELSRSTRAVLVALRQRGTALASALAADVRLSHQRADGCLHELEALGLVKRLPGQTAAGYEWEATP